MLTIAVIVLAIVFLIALPFIMGSAANVIVIGLILAVVAAIGLGIFYFGNSALVYLSSGTAAAGVSQASQNAHSLLVLLLFFVMPLIAFCGVVAAKGRKGQTARDQSERVSESDLHRT